MFSQGLLLADAERRADQMLATRLTDLRQYERQGRSNSPTLMEEHKADQVDVILESIFEWSPTLERTTSKDGADRFPQNDSY